MNLLLLLFALPIATIIFSIVLQKILNSPILVALTVFAVYLILAFTAFDESFLVFAILYTILAYITAAISRFIKKMIRRCLCNQNNSCDNESGEQDENDNNDLDDENSNCGCCRPSLVIDGRYRNRRYWR